MKKRFATAIAASCLMTTQAHVIKRPLAFDANKGIKSSLSMPNGQKVNFTAYRKIYFVSNVEDTTYQYMNIFVPDGATQHSAIFLRTYVGGYMESQAGEPQSADASGRALANGYVLVIPGSRGRQSTVKVNKKTVYTGRAPKALLDLKAAIRYLRHFDKVIPGDAERIITDGTSAGGAMSALMGATGNNPAYNALLKTMGAADERDDVFASVCFCPITDLAHADMAYEWLYGTTGSRKALGVSKRKMIQALTTQFSTYVNSLGLKKDNGTPLNTDNYLDYLKQIIIRSAQEAKDAGANIPDTIGFKFSDQAAFRAPINGGMGLKPQGGKPLEKKMPDGMKIQNGKNMPEEMKPMDMFDGKEKGEYITDLDMAKYLNYVVSTQPLKSVPAFGSYGVDGALASGENGEFGDDNGSDVNFTEWAATQSGHQLTEATKENERLLNPMCFIDDSKTTVAQHWYIRHGARDRDTAFPIAINLATKLQNSGKDVNFKLPWNRPHSGDYALNEVFEWIRSFVK